MKPPTQGAPSGLDRRQLATLRRLADRAAGVPIAELLREAEDHLAATEKAHRADPFVDLRFAAAIVAVVRQLAAEWDELPADARPWLRGAIRYFTAAEDEEPDLRSPFGFEDDAEILNACLRLAGRDALCIRPEDYDDLAVSGSMPKY